MTTTFPGLVRDDVCDLGFVGLNIVEETRLGLCPPAAMAPIPSAMLRNGWITAIVGCPLVIRKKVRRAGGRVNCGGRRIATSYPNIGASDYLQRQEQIGAEVVEFSGAVEIAPSLGRADVICDLVSTGTTMAAHKIREGETILDSEAVVHARPRWKSRRRNRTGSTG